MDQKLTTFETNEKDSGNNFLPLFFYFILKIIDKTILII